MENLIEALQILSGYLTDDYYFNKYPTRCDHDVLRVCVDYTEISEEDLKRLEELGFVPDKYSGYMVSYRYGSN